MPEGLGGYFPDVDAEPSAEFADELLARLRAEFDVGRAPARPSPVSRKVVVTLTPIDERVDVADIESEPHRRRRWWAPAVAAAAVAAVIAIGVVASRVGAISRSSFPTFKSCLPWRRRLPGLGHNPLRPLTPFGAVAKFRSRFQPLSARPGD